MFFDKGKILLFCNNAEILILTLALSTCFITGQGAPCSSSNLGNTNINAIGQSTSNDTGRQYVMEDTEFVSTCCGYVTGWVIQAGNTGDIIFQVWRPTGSNFELIGENTVTISSTGTVSSTVVSGDRIVFQANDVIGWYTSGTDIVRYRGWGNRNDNNNVETMSAPSVGDVVSFSTQLSNRDYSFYATVTGGSSPVFTNLDATVTIGRNFGSTTATIFTVTASDTDVGDTVTYSVQSSSPSNDFTISSTTGAVTAVTTSLTVATYSVVIRATDACGNTADATLTIEVTNQTPVIHSLPDVVYLSESAVDESLLHSVNVTDGDGDVVTCSLTSTPAAGPFTIKYLIVDSQILPGIYVQSNPNFDYSSTSTFTLSLTCTDDAGAGDTGILYVYITQNNVPVILNLQNSTSFYSNLSTSSMIFQVLATDSEGDQLSFSLNCVSPTAPCPFTIYSEGSITLTSSLLGSTNNAYELDITVTDSYSSSGTHRLTAFVIDLNVAPVLTNLPASIQVTEDTSVGTVVFDTLAYDDDGDTSLTFTATYSPSTSADLFSIDSSTGEVSVSSSLNYLTQVNNYTLTIQVFDGVASSTSLTLDIETVDVNQAPVLYQTNYQVEASEGAAGTSFPDPGYNVYDADADADTLTYAFGGGNNSAGFVINSTNGIVTYSIAYDLDDGSTNITSFVWLITISDPDGLAATATLTVSIVDLNDNVPYFSSTAYSTVVASNAPLGTVIFTVTSSDDDFSSLHRQVEYTMHNTNQFTIDHNGNIIVFDSLLQYVDTIDSCYVRVRNPGVNSYDTAYLAIHIYRPSSDDYFDDPANIAWVTLTCLLVPLVLIGLTYLAYRCVHMSWATLKPPLQVAPYQTRMPASRPVSEVTGRSIYSKESSKVRSVTMTPVTPSDIHVIEKGWQAWNNGQSWNP